MKRIIALLLSLILIFSFSACSKDENGKEKTTTSTEEITGIGTTVKVTTTVNNDGGSTLKNDATIPHFSVEGTSAAVDSLNSRIESEIVAFCTEMAADPLDYAVVKTQIYETGKYVQVICVVSKFMSSSMNGVDVKSYVYDRATDTEITLDKAYEQFEYTDSSAKRIALEYYENVGDLVDFEVQGFYINQSGIIEFIAKAKVNDGETDFYETLTVIPETKYIAPMEDGQVIVKE